MLQEAIITNIRDDGLAEVVVERLGICGGDCNTCEGCRYDNLMKSVVQNPIGAHRGQHVMIDTPTSRVYLGALAIYVLPLLTLIIGYFVAAALELSEGLCVALALGGAAIGVLIAWILGRKKHTNDPNPSVIVSIIENL